ncbi:MAG: 50S ribosomal protein L18a [Methanospirillum sp.]|nr:50S ribosomal protein L18a [Methanospirillum sp.]
MKQYSVSGTFRCGDEWRPFMKTVSAPNEAQAQERIMTIIGSKHRLKRMYITVDGVTALSGE